MAGMITVADITAVQNTVVDTVAVVDITDEMDDTIVVGMIEDLIMGAVVDTTTVAVGMTGK